MFVFLLGHGHGSWFFVSRTWGLTSRFSVLGVAVHGYVGLGRSIGDWRERATARGMGSQKSQFLEDGGILVEAMVQTSAAEGFANQNKKI